MAAKYSNIAPTIRQDLRKTSAIALQNLVSTILRKSYGSFVKTVLQMKLQRMSKKRLQTESGLATRLP
jgi:hypothetical protein